MSRSDEVRLAPNYDADPADSGEVTIDAFAAATSTSTLARLGGPITALAAPYADVLAIGSAHGHVALARTECAAVPSWPC